ncbi:MAG TPA: glycerophosphodiester phosphodiesterase family protein [Candidatus Limnocylindrales bacterium]|nr:glycerophosphodiester phosphodiesterase family protein [Candidatus Limnocylindrales bacterium]
MTGRWLRPDRPLVIAHRGHAVGCPENTIAAYRRAIELGAEMIEADVRRTADDALVLLHDATLARTTDGRGPVGCSTLAEVRRLDAGSWFGAAFAGETVPTLDELLDLAEAERITLCLEAKGESTGEATAVAVEIARRVVRRRATDRVVLSSFDHAALASARRLVPELALAPDRLPERGPLAAREAVGQASRIGAEVLQVHHAELSDELVAVARAAGIALWAWPTTLPAEIERAQALGVDGLMGDDVEAICRAVGADRPPGG